MSIVAVTKPDGSLRPMTGKTGERCLIILHQMRRGGWFYAKELGPQRWEHNSRHNTISRLEIMGLIVRKVLRPDKTRTWESHQNGNQLMYQLTDRGKACLERLPSGAVYLTRRDAIDAFQKAIPAPSGSESQV